VLYRASTKTETLTNKTISAETNTLVFLGQPTQTWSIYYSGTTIMARNNKTGLIPYTDTSGNIDTILASIIGAISPAGTPTSIEIGEGDFKIAAPFIALSSTRVGNIRIKGQGIGITNLIGQTTLTGALTIMIDIKGAVSGTGKNLMANAIEGSLTVTVSTGDSASFAAGDYLLLRSSKDFTTAASKRGPQGEIHRVRAVNTGTGVVTLDHEIYDTYNTANTSNIIKLTMLQNIAIEDLSIKAAAGYTAENAFLKCTFVDNLFIRNVEIVDSIGQYNSGLYLVSCINFDVDRAVCVQTPSNAYNLQYGVICESACQNGRIFVQGKGKLRHAFTTSGRVGANTAGVVRNVEISGTSENTAAAHFDTHADSQGIVFRNCNVISAGKDSADMPNDNTPSAPAIQSRSRGTVIEGCSFINMKGMGIALAEDAHNTVVSGCLFSKTKKSRDNTKGFALEIDAVTGTTITGCTFANGPVASATVELLAGSHDTVISGNTFVSTGAVESIDCTDVVISNNRMKMGTDKAINMTGTSDYFTISGNNATGSAASTIIGSNNQLSNNINILSKTPSFEAYRRTGITNNRWYIANQISSAALGTMPLVANTLYAMPFIVSKTAIINDIGINVTAGITSALVRVGIYNELNGYPRSLLKDAGTLAGDTIAFVSTTVSPTLSLDPGIYWLVCVSGHTPTIKAVQTTDSYPMLGFDDVAATQNVGVGWSVSFTMAALPSIFTAGAAVRTGVMPGVYVRLV
jgi:hypothetical protein